MSKKDKDIDVPIRFIVAVFDKYEEEAVPAYKELKENETLGMQQAALLYMDEKEKLHIKETDDTTGGQGAAVGGGIGLAVGILAGPIGLAAAGVGALAGGLYSKLRDSGFPDHKLEEVGKMLKPGMAAIATIVTLDARDAAQQSLTDFGADAMTEVLDAAAVKQLVEVVEAQAGEADAE